MTDQATQVEATQDVDNSLDYASFSLSIDHLMVDDAIEGRAFGTRSRVIHSTETALESVIAQLAYFGLTDKVLAQPGVPAMLANAENTATIFILQGRDGLTNVIVDNALAETFLVDERHNPGKTLLGAHASLVGIATEVIAQARRQYADPNRSILLAYVPD